MANIDMAEEIVNKLYAAYGTGSGILFGITERAIVETIVKFTIHFLPEIEDNIPTDCVEW